MNESIHTVISQMVGQLVNATEQGLEGRTLTLIKQNQALGGVRLGYVFSDSIYALPNLHNKAVREVKPIDHTLFNAAQDLHRDHETFRKDRQLLVQGLGILLAPCTTWQDIRDALPEFAKGLLEQTTKLTRTRDEAWTLQELPLRLHGYEATKRCINLFMAERMLI